MPAVLQSLAHPAPQPSPVLLQDGGAMPQWLVLGHGIRPSQTLPFATGYLLEKSLHWLLNEKSDMYLSCQH